MGRSSEKRPGRGGRPHLPRRALLSGALALGGAAGAGALARTRAQPQPPPGATDSPPTQALQRRVLSTDPLIAEAPVEDLTGLLVPNRVHFIRTHYGVPEVDAATWTLSVEGAVRQPLQLTLAELQALPSRTLTCFIECSGNSRGQFQPPASGSRWGNGGVSVAEWTGVPLSTVLEAAGASDRAVDVLAEGADGGRVYSAIPVQKALDPDTLVAYAQNGEWLTRENGYPVRLVVPGWGGIRSIKWLTKLTVTDEPWEGYYNNRVYVYETPGLPKTPVQAMGVKSFITRPRAGAELSAGGPVTIQGFAYSGVGQITRVEVSIDGGEWRAARLLEPVLRWAWVRWQYVWENPTAGEVRLRSRSTDQDGNVQPETVAWNRYGYGNNSIQTVTVRVG